MNSHTDPTGLRRNGGGRLRPVVGDGGGIDTLEDEVAVEILCVTSVAMIEYKKAQKIINRYRYKGIVRVTKATARA